MIQILNGYSRAEMKAELRVIIDPHPQMPYKISLNILMKVRCENFNTKKTSRKCRFSYNSNDKAFRDNWAPRCTHMCSQLAVWKLLDQMCAQNDKLWGKLNYTYYECAIAESHGNLKQRPGSVLLERDRYVLDIQVWMRQRENQRDMYSNCKINKKFIED